MRQWVVPALAIIYFLAMLVAMTYPGYVPFNRIRPFVLGMPFSLVWQLIWINGAVLVLAGVFLWDKKFRRDPRSSQRPSGPTGAEGR